MWLLCEAWFETEYNSLWWGCSILLQALSVEVKTPLPPGATRTETGSVRSRVCCIQDMHLDGWPLAPAPLRPPLLFPAAAPAQTRQSLPTPSRGLVPLPTAHLPTVSLVLPGRSQEKGNQTPPLALGKLTEPRDRRHHRDVLLRRGTHRVPDRQEVVEQQRVRPPCAPAAVQVELGHLPDGSPGNEGEQSNQQAHGIQVKRLQPGGKEPGER